MGFLKVRQELVMPREVFFPNPLNKPVGYSFLT